MINVIVYSSSYNTDFLLREIRMFNPLKVVECLVVKVESMLCTSK